MTGIRIAPVVPKALRNSGGFSLIELMVVVVMVSILAALAVPAYQSSVLKGKRSDAKAALSELASLQEQYFMDNKVYAPDLTSLGYGSTSDAGNYSVTLVAYDASCPNTSCYKLKATAIGGQADDTDCFNFFLDSLGQESSTKNDGSASSSSCW